MLVAAVIYSCILGGVTKRGSCIHETTIPVRVKFEFKENT